jgi:SPP1 family predicted phage head-tail adaptor
MSTAANPRIIKVVAGALFNRITIQINAGTTQGTDGQPTDNWITYKASVPAEVRPLSGRELLIGTQVSPEVSRVVTIRYMAGIVPEMRITWGTKTFEINSVINRYEQNVLLDLYCKEIPGLPRS